MVLYVNLAVICYWCMSTGQLVLACSQSVARTNPSAISVLLDDQLYDLSCKINQSLSDLILFLLYLFCIAQLRIEASE